MQQPVVDSELDVVDGLASLIRAKLVPRDVHKTTLRSSQGLLAQAACTHRVAMHSQGY